MVGLILVIKFNRLSYRFLKVLRAVLVLLLFISTSLVYGQAKAYKTYEGEYLHSGLKKTSFSIEFPSDWEVDDLLADAAKREPVIIDFISPLEKPTDDFRERVTLEIADLHPRPPLKVYFEGKELPELGPEFKKLERGPALIAGQEGNYTIYQGVDHCVGRELKYKAYVFVIYDTETIYALTYAAEPQKYDKFLPEVEKTIKSFSLSSPQPQDPKKNWKTYQSREFNQISFSIAYPPDWEPKELSPFSFGLISPEGQRAMITASVQDLGEAAHSSLVDYIKRHDQKIQTRTLNYKQLQREKSSIAGQDAYLTVYTYTDTVDSNWHLKVKTYTFVVNDRFAFDLGYAGSLKEYDIFFFVAEDIINSFQLSLSAPVESFAMEPPQQGTFIPCEECVILYPEKYKDKSQSCQTCSGQKEHFQPARLMFGELAAVEARELELKIEDFLLRIILDAHKKPVPIETLSQIRDSYKEKLIFHLIYDKFELEPIKAHIVELDELISKSK